MMMVISKCCRVRQLNAQRHADYEQVDLVLRN